MHEHRTVCQRQSGFVATKGVARNRIVNSMLASSHLFDSLLPGLSTFLCSWCRKHLDSDLTSTPSSGRLCHIRSVRPRLLLHDLLTLSLSVKWTIQWHFRTIHLPPDCVRCFVALCVPPKSYCKPWLLWHRTYTVTDVRFFLLIIFWSHAVNLKSTLNMSHCIVCYRFAVFLGVPPVITGGPT